MGFSEYCQRLSALYQTQQVPFNLAAPASDAALLTAEQQLGFSIAASLRSAWQVADGGDSWQAMFARPNFLTGYDFLSLQQALAARASMQRRAPNYADYQAPKPRDPRIDIGWFQPHWLPFAAFSGGELLLIFDHKQQQIIGFQHDPDTMVWVCDDFSQLLHASLMAFEQDPDEFIFPE